MTERDIVERLEEASHDDRLQDGMLYREAAAEIRRLREDLSGTIDGWQDQPGGGWPEAENLKETNPKEFFGNKKVPLELFPDSALAAGAMAMLEGALKYGRYNYRISGIRASVYVAATRRHLAAYWNGRDIDEKSGLPHLWKALACLAVVIDAQAAGQFLDDRPPAVDMDAMMDELEGEVARLKEELGHHTPRQYTIADSGSTPPRPSE